MSEWVPSYDFFFFQNYSLCISDDAWVPHTLPYENVTMV